MDGKTRYHSLDGLRGLAISFVVFSHLSNINQLFFRGSGKVGVWLFFILSSFLLSSYFLSDITKVNDKRELISYASRRFFRIMPMYLLALCVYYIYGIYINSNYKLLESFALVQGCGIFWTIPVEMKFYILLPFIILFISQINGFKGYKKERHAYLILVMVIIVHQIIYYSYTDAYEPNSIKLILYLPIFLVGVIAASINLRLNSIDIPANLKRLLDIAALLVIVIIFLTLPSIWSMLVKPVPSDYFHRHFMIYSFMWSIFIISVLNGSGFFKKILENPILMTIGRISFSIYICHILIINQVLRYISNDYAIYIPVSLVLIMAISSVLYVSIEKPLSRVNIIQTKLNRQATRISIISRGRSKIPTNTRLQAKVEISRPGGSDLSYRDSSSVNSSHGLKAGDFSLCPLRSCELKPSAQPDGLKRSFLSE